MIKTKEDMFSFTRILCCNKCGKEFFLNPSWKLFYPFAGKIKDEELEDMLVICRDCLKTMTNPLDPKPKEEVKKDETK